MPVSAGGDINRTGMCYTQTSPQQTDVDTGVTSAFQWRELLCV